MIWGGTWGLLWGLGGALEPGPWEVLASDQRPLEQMDRRDASRNFRRLLGIFGSAVDEYIEVAQDVIASVDIDTATGDRLDKIGAVIGLPRQGYADARYRELLKLWRLVMLPARREGAQWTGTGDNILAICRAFAPAAGTITLTNLPPYAFTLSVPGVPPEDVPLLFRFVCKALYAGVLGRAYVGSTNGSVLGSVHGPVVNEGHFSSVHGPIGNLPLLFGATFSTSGGSSSGCGG